MSAVPYALLERDGIPEIHYRRRWWTLAVLTLSLVMVVMANSSLNVAMPTFVESLGTSDTELQWIVDAYALVFGGLLLTMGALGDRFGRKGALQVGLVIFGAATLATALFAESGTHVIVTRAIMGIGAALVMPATLSILTTVFPREERGKAIGIWAAFAGLGGMIGLISSGWLLEQFAWRSIFWLNVPIVTASLVAGWWLVPTSRDPDQAPLDIVGSTLSILALGGLLFAIIEGPNEGWTSPLIVGTGIISLLVLAVFVGWERRSDHPMLPMRFFSERGFNAGTIVILLTFFAMFATFFVLTQYIQFVQGYSPLEAGIRFLPLGLGMVLGAPNSDRLVRRLGAAPVVTTGLVLVAGGLASLALLEAGDGYWRVGTTFVLMGVGMGLSMAPATTVIMSSIPARKAGVGSSMNDTAREVGGAFGIAILGTILKDVYVTKVRDVFPAGMPDTAKAAAETGVGQALAVAADMGPEGAAFAAAAKAAFASAMTTAFWTASAIVVVAALVVFTFFPRRIDRPEKGPAPKPGATLDDAQAAQAPSE